MKKGWLGGCAVLASAVLCAALIVLTVLAAPAQGRDITADCTIEGAEEDWLDGKETTYTSLPAGETVAIHADEIIGGLYLRFDRMPSGELTLSGGGKAVTVKPEFLHQYLDVGALLDGVFSEIALIFSEKTEIADLFVLSTGAVPDFVQVWEPPCEQADLLLAPTHADDDQLFFLGILPYYAGELGYEVQVVYYTNHNNVHNRPHELLNGLWTVGVRHYPVIAEMRDAWDGETETLEYGYANFASQGFSKADLIDFWVRMIRRFQPQVIVGHDVDGEYGHPQHMVNTDTLIEALKVCGSADYILADADDAPYEPEKVYLHLWDENPITLDWDQPLSAFDGMTAYEVSKLGYACHLSQQWTWFTSWIQGSAGQYTKSTDIRTHSPNKYGLYFTRVGQDTVGGDFFEHVTVRSQIPPQTEPSVTTAPITEPPATTAPPETDPISTEPITTPPAAPTAAPTDWPTEPIPTSPKQDDGKGLALAAALLLLTAAGIGTVCILRRKTPTQQERKSK